MARREVVTLVDDLDPEEVASETVSFGLDGQNYEIDLHEDNAAQFRDLLKQYTDAGRKVGKQKTRKK